MTFNTFLNINCRSYEGSNLYKLLQESRSLQDLCVAPTAPSAELWPLTVSGGLDGLLAALHKHYFLEIIT